MGLSAKRKFLLGFLIGTSKHLPIQSPVLNGFEQVMGRYSFLILQVRNGSGYLEDAVVGPCAEAELLNRLLEKSVSCGIDLAVSFYVARLHESVGIDEIAREPLELPFSCSNDSFPYRRGGFGGMG